MLAIGAAMPFVLYQAWAFVAPGLYRHEKKLAVPLLISSILLFYLGAAFAYYAVVPVMLSFFIATTPTGVQMMTDMGNYLDFVMVMLLAFGAHSKCPWPRSSGVDRLRQHQIAQEKSRLRDIGTLHFCRLRHAARRGLADRDGGADVSLVRDRDRDAGLLLKDKIAERAKEEAEREAGA